VFFVISGFLITTQLVSEMDRTGGISLRAFYARRAKRILPAAAVVLVATAVAVYLFVPRIRWQDVGGDIVSAAAYVVNWRLANRAVDYLAQDSPPSPVQHFWSLAVEEQFYLVWPLLILAAILVAKAIRRRRVRPILAVGLAVVAVPSFAYSVAYTASNPQRAFFVTTTRMWELAIGAAIALAATQANRMPRAIAVLIGWLGLAAIVVAGMVFSAATPWPGYAGALPTLGAAAVITAGAAAGSRGPVAILGIQPFRWVGDLSYSLYLWHWPMIVVATAHWHGLSVARGLAVAAASVIPAWITFHVVENPLRHSRTVSRSPRLALSLGGAFSLAGASAGLLLLVAVSSGAVNPAAALHAPGAAALTNVAGGGLAPAFPDHPAFITPDPLKAIKDVPVTTPDGCFQDPVSAEVKWCTYGDTKSATHVVLVGDSKVDQWFSAFELLAEQNDWKLSIAAKSACGLTSAPSIVGYDAAKPYTSCTQWNRSLLSRLIAERPTYVITSQGSSVASDGNGHASADAMADGMRASWAALDAAGIKVVVIANNPSPSVNVDQCVDEHREHVLACTFPSSLHQLDNTFMTQKAAVAMSPEVKMVDLFDTICPATDCPPVIGNVLVYRQGSHLTSTYVKSMTPQIAARLSSVGMSVHYTAHA
jgi:peptidoglycan/LPS O-acetylase OafA/YrhL